ncbi:aminopeptidase [Eubacteriaceae bacterium ES2]|nr:aminopeptidase [Eubacteriaceae bacterium ES2]
MSHKEKSAGTLLKEKLEKNWESAWKDFSEDDQMQVFSDDYLGFLTNGKTERQWTNMSVQLAENAGYRPLEKFQKKEKLKAGDKLYAVHKNKTVILFNIGKQAIAEGMAIIGAHIDAPRLDLKPAPLYESESLGLFKTHYYGGIKKYQWVTIPLAIHGRVMKKDGGAVDITIGEDANDPVFCITDLLPHLAKEQNGKKLDEAITGEGLNLLIGSRPYPENELKDGVKTNLLKILNDKYGIVEEDFATAELEVVPAGAARNVGFDESLIGGYGQDDRVCSFTALRAILDQKDPANRTQCVILADKEEIGSVGNTGMHSRFFENTVAEVIDLLGEKKAELALRRCLMNSAMLSADVTAGVDPNYSGTHDKLNAPYLGKGIVLSKYGGARGKSGSNDAHAEFMGKMRKLMDDGGVVWQMGELGRIDLGGGGTIAYILAEYGMDVLDCGPALLSMHAPFEISSKIDVYMTYKGYREFLKSY